MNSKKELWGLWADRGIFSHRKQDVATWLRGLSRAPLLSLSHDSLINFLFECPQP